MRPFLRITALLAILALGGAIPAVADTYKDYVGYTALQNELGGDTPTGAGVQVTQAEATSTATSTDYFPSTSNIDTPGSEFYGKTITPITSSYSTSSHATGVGQLFYGNNTSMAPGINHIDVYNANDWLGSGFLNTGSNSQPLASSSRVANHSWVGYYSASEVNSEALRRLDWVIARDNYIQVVAMQNGGAPATVPLLGSSFNAITVGRSDGEHGTGSVVIDSDTDVNPVYKAGRTRPDIVAPMGVTSSATPVVASAAALLVQTGHQDPSLSRDPLVNFTTNRYTDQNNDGQKIYNAERSEVVKAALMAGADRSSAQFSQAYTVNPNSNGLSDLYGAGQVNIYNSYHIVAAGEFNSLEDQPGNLGIVQRYGFDYDPYFGGQSGSNTTGSYYFHTGGATGTLTVSLVWNLKIDGGTDLNFVDTATLYNLDLYLYDLSVSSTNPLASSSSDQDNTENIYLTSLAGNHDYLLKVVLGSGQDNFLWDYGLAWNITNAVPLPGTWLLFGSGLAALGFFRVSRRRPS
jgi:hypothetical protein